MNEKNAYIFKIGQLNGWVEFKLRNINQLIIIALKLYRPVICVNQF
jgi:hypothetical protein